MMTPAQFYANVGDLFGIIGPNRTSPHRGVDFPWAAGTAIPAWGGAGTVAMNYWSSVIGWVLSVKLDKGGWAGYCHMEEQSPLAVGARVAYGQDVGGVGNTGSASRGAHLHATYSESGANPGTATVIDPLPHIRASVTAALDTSPLIESDDDMPRMIRSKSRSVDYVVSPGHLYASPSAGVTAELKAHYGESSVFDDTGMNIHCRALDIPDTIWKKIPAGSAWDPSRGIHVASAEPTATSTSGTFPTLDEIASAVLTKLTAWYKRA